MPRHPSEGTYMSKVVRNYKKLAVLMGFSFDKKSKILYGQKDGFSIIIDAPNYKEPYRFVVHVSARATSDEMTKQDIWQFMRQFTTENPITTLEREHNLVLMAMGKETNQQQLYQKLQKSINALISFLRLKGFEPCCASCGQNVETSVYSVGALYGKGYISMCPACVSKMKTDIAYENFLKHENILGGIAGALLGSVIGAVLILLLAQLRLISVILGFAMAICTFRGYTLLGKKMTKKGIVICTLMVLFMTYACNRMDWAIFLVAVQPDIDIFTAFRIVPYLLKEGLIDTSTFWGNLFKLYVCTIGGVIVEIYAALNNGKITKIGP